MNTISYILLAIGLTFALCLALLATVFARTHIHNKPLKIRRKRLRMMFYLFLLTLSLTLVMGGVIIYGTNIGNLVQFWKETIINRGFICQILCFIGFFLYAYFRKDKTSKEKENV
jgi:hypothetical protein